MGMLTGFTGISAVEAIDFATSILVRGAILLAMAFALLVLLGRARAALRHHVMALAMAGLVALPMLAVATPDWRVDVPGASALAGLVGETAPDAARTSDAEATATGEGERTASGAVVLPARTPTAPEAGKAGAVGTRTAGAASSSSASSPLSLPGALLAVWMVGTLFLVCRLLVGGIRAARLVRRAEPVTDSRWNVLVSRLSLRAGLRSSVRLVSSAEVDVPMAWGIFSSWLVLPGGIEDWPEERRRVVVLHELAHLKRRDCLLRAMGELTLAIHWVDPLAWLALRRMRSEREQACDDEVLAAGVGGPAYAHHLVDIARGLTRRPQPARAAVAMARPSELENRVLAILDDARSRRGLGRTAWRAGALALLALLVPLAMLQPAPAEPADEAGGETVERTPVVQEAIADPSEAEARTSAPDVESDVAAGDGFVGESAASKDTDVLTRPATDLQQDTIEERVFRALERALGSEDPDVRRRVARTFGNIESPRGVGPLSSLLRDDPDAGVRAAAAWGLGMIESDEGVDALAVAVRAADASVKKQAVWALGMIESSRGVQHLLPLLADEDPEVRKKAAWALGMIESADAVDALGSAFASEDVPEVRSEIIWALGMIEDRKAMETLADALEDSDREVREQALWALGMVMN